MTMRRAGDRPPRERERGEHPVEAVARLERARPRARSACRRRGGAAAGRARTARRPRRSARSGSRRGGAPRAARGTRATPRWRRRAGRGSAAGAAPRAGTPSPGRKCVWKVPTTGPVAWWMASSGSTGVSGACTWTTSNRASRSRSRTAPDRRARRSPARRRRCCRAGRSVPTRTTSGPVRVGRRGARPSSTSGISLVTTVTRCPSRRASRAKWRTCSWIPPTLGS